MRFRSPYILLLMTTTSVLAFDNDPAIYQPNFNTEHYLDINKAEFDENLDELWYQSENGWRLSAHSLTTDQTYVNTHVKLAHTLSEYLSMRLEYEQEIEIADEELLPPELELEIHPLPKYPVSISLVGSYTYEKAGSELGYAVTYGDCKLATAGQINYVAISISVPVRRCSFFLMTRSLPLNITVMNTMPL